jgi:hypothetical protein
LTGKDSPQHNTTSTKWYVIMDPAPTTQRTSRD